MERGGTLQSNSLKAIIVLALVVIIWAILGLSQHDIGTTSMNRTNITTLNANVTIELTIPITSTADANVTTINVTTNSSSLAVYNVSINDANYSCTQSSTVVTCNNVSDVLTQNATFVVTVDVTATADGTYQFDITTADNNSETNSTSIATFTVDSTVPTWSTTNEAPAANANISGTLTISEVSFTDVNQDNNSVYFRLLNSTGNNVTDWIRMRNDTSAAASTANYSSSVSTTGLTDG